MSPKKIAANEVVAELIGDDAVPYDAAGLDADFAKLVRDRQKLYTKKKEIEAAIEERTGVIQALVEATGHKHLSVDDEWRVTLAEGRKGAKKIDAQLLMTKAKLSATMIAACTVEGAPGKPYILISEIKK
jgi:hypothetical protein